MAVTQPAEPNPDLILWLYNATEDLAPEAAERHRAELAVHFRDAVVFHVERGETESAAAERSLAEMGDPRVVNRRLKKTCLTRDDLTRARSRATNVRMARVFAIAGVAWWVFLLPAIVGAFAIGFGVPSIKQFFGANLSLFVFCLLFFGAGALSRDVSVLIATRLYGKTTERRRLVIESLVKFFDFSWHLLSSAPILFFFWKTQRPWMGAFDS